MTPIYIGLCILARIIELLTDITEPIADGMREFTETMIEFWKKFLKGRGK